MGSFFVSSFVQNIFKPGKRCPAAVRWTEERSVPSVDSDVRLEVGELEVGLPARLLLAPEGPHPDVLIIFLIPEKYNMHVQGVPKKTVILV